MTDTLLADIAAENNRLLAENKALNQQLAEVRRSAFHHGYASHDDELRGLKAQLAECRKFDAWKDNPYTTVLEKMLTACQAECEEEARLNGAGGSREADLIAQIAEVQAQAIKDVNHFRKVAAEAQAREKVLRDALELHGQMYPHMVKGYCLDALAMPSDSTALDLALREEFIRGYDEGFIVGTEKGRNFEEEIRQAKREALQSVIDAVNANDGMLGLKVLHQMAEGLK